MRALVTGFEPFGGESINASLEAVRRLPARIAAIDVITAELPTSYARSLPALEAAIAGAQPEMVLCVGQARDRGVLCVERIAVNVQDTNNADNDGARPVKEPVVRGGPAAYLSTLPARALVAALRAEALPAQLSMSAGTFVCNHVFYHLMHLAAARRDPFIGGLLHVPGLPQQSAGTAAAMALEDIVRAIEIVVEASARKPVMDDG